MKDKWMGVANSVSGPGAVCFNSNACMCKLTGVGYADRITEIPSFLYSC